MSGVGTQCCVGRRSFVFGGNSSSNMKHGRYGRLTPSSKNVWRHAEQGKMCAVKGVLKPSSSVLVKACRGNVALCQGVKVPSLLTSFIPITPSTNLRRRARRSERMQGYSYRLYGYASTEHDTKNRLQRDAPAGLYMGMQARNMTRRI